MNRAVIYLFSMWIRPKMLVWFLATTITLLLVRWPFIRVPILPYLVDFNPGIVLVPVAGVLAGPAGAWGALAASLAGDALFGLWSPLSVYRATGMFLCAVVTWKLWEIPASHTDSCPSTTPEWCRTLRFIVVSMPGLFAAATWPALGAEKANYYPFCHIASMLLIQNVIFCAALGLALYRVIARELVPHCGTWRSTMPAGDQGMAPTRFGAGLIVIGSLGGWLAGIMSCGLHYQMWPLHVYTFGQATGEAVGQWVMPFLALQVLGLCWPDRRR